MTKCARTGDHFCEKNNDPIGLTNMEHDTPCPDCERRPWWAKVREMLVSGGARSLRVSDAPVTITPVEIRALIAAVREAAAKDIGVELGRLMDAHAAEARKDGRKAVVKAVCDEIDQAMFDGVKDGGYSGQVNAVTLKLGEIRERWGGGDEQ